MLKNVPAALVLGKRVIKIKVSIHSVYSNRDKLKVKYTGSFLADGKVFDGNLESTETFDFTLGT